MKRAPWLYTLMQIALWSIHGVLISYAQRYLAGMGMRDSAIGLLLGGATAAGFVLLGFGNQLKLLRRRFVDLNLRFGSSRRIDYSFLANFDLHEFFAVMAVRPGSVADILKCKCRFAR